MNNGDQILILPPFFYWTHCTSKSSFKSGHPEARSGPHRQAAVHRVGRRHRRQDGQEQEGAMPEELPGAVRVKA